MFFDFKNEKKKAVNILGMGQNCTKTKLHEDKFAPRVILARVTIFTGHTCTRVKVKTQIYKINNIKTKG